MFGLGRERQEILIDHDRGLNGSIDDPVFIEFRPVAARFSSRRPSLMNADTHRLPRRLVENAKEQHQLEADLVNLLLDSDDNQVTQIRFYLLDKLCTDFSGRDIQPNWVDLRSKLRTRLGQLQHKLDAIDDEALARYAEWAEDGESAVVRWIA